MSEGPPRQTVAERLAEAKVVPGKIYELVRFTSGDFGVTRNGVPLVYCQYEPEAKEMFDLVTRPSQRPPTSPQRRRRRRGR